MQQDALEHIYDTLKSVFIDVKAEAIVAELLEHAAIDFSDISIARQSTFSRTFRRDIIGYSLGFTRDDRQMLSIQVSRSGIYDTLPEGVFHNAANPALKSLSYQKKRELQKREEKEARLFFQPIENEIFHQQVAIEQKERSLHDHFASIKNDFLLDFWQIEKGLPLAYIKKLIKLLPHTHRIAGSYEITATCLEKIIELPVHMEATFAEDANYSAHRAGERDSSEKSPELGIDFVLAGDQSVIMSPQLQVTIGPIPKERAAQFVAGQPYMKFLDLFYRYMVPMEMEVKTSIEIERENLTFTLDEQEPPLMGLTSVL